MPLRELSMHQFMDDLSRAVSGFRASEQESESEQSRVYLGRAKELALVEQRIAAQAALVSQTEHRICEEHAAMCQSKQNGNGNRALRLELDEVIIERDRHRADLIGATGHRGCRGVAARTAEKG